MIFTDKKIYAKVWKITRREEKYLDLRISTSEKDLEGNYINSTWFPRLIGHAFNSLKDKVKEGDRIVITKAKLTNESYEKDGVTKSAFKFLILEAEIDGQETNPAQAPAPAAPSRPQPADKDACPW